MAWSCDSSTFFITTNGFKSYATCYQLNISSSDVSIKLLWNAVPPPSAGATEEKLIQKQHLSPAKTYKYGNVFTACEPTNSGNCVVLEERDDKNDVIHLFSNTGTILKSHEIATKSVEKKSEVLVLSSVKDGVSVVSLLGGVIVVFNSETLETVSSFETIKRKPQYLVFTC